MNSEEKELAEMIPHMRNFNKMIRLLGAPDEVVDGTSIEQEDLLDLYETGRWKHEYIYRNKWKTFILRVKESETNTLHFFTTDRDGANEVEYLF